MTIIMLWQEAHAQNGGFRAAWPIASWQSSGIVPATILIQ
jgi:hypothetical protein